MTTTQELFCPACIPQGDTYDPKTNKLRPLTAAEYGRLGVLLEPIEGPAGTTMAVKVVCRRHGLIDFPTALQHSLPSELLAQLSGIITIEDLAGDVGDLFQRLAGLVGVARDQRSPEEIVIAVESQVTYLRDFVERQGNEIGQLTAELLATTQALEAAQASPATEDQEEKPSESTPTTDDLEEGEPSPSPTTDDEPHHKRRKRSRQ